MIDKSVYDKSYIQNEFNNNSTSENEKKMQFQVISCDSIRFGISLGNSFRVKKIFNLNFSIIKSNYT